LGGWISFGTEVGKKSQNPPIKTREIYRILCGGVTFERPQMTGQQPKRGGAGATAPPDDEGETEKLCQFQTKNRRNAVVGVKKKKKAI